MPIVNIPGGQNNINQNNFDEDLNISSGGTFPFGVILDGSTQLSTMERLKKAQDDALLKKEWFEQIAATPWPNAIVKDFAPYAGGPATFGTNKGFLPLNLITPFKDSSYNASDSSGSGLYGTDLTTSDGNVYSSTFTEKQTVTLVKDKYGQYEWTDWTGQKLATKQKLFNTEDRFKPHTELLTSNDLLSDKYSFRDFALIFGDTKTDYFRFGLQTIDGLVPIENPRNGSSDLRLDMFKGTPWEQQDPVYFGFDIIFDAVSSPLLNGSILDFIANYSGVDEIKSRLIVYDEFINQFTKFFRTNAKPRTYQPDSIAFTKNFPSYTGDATSFNNFANLDENTNLFRPGKSAYLAHYIKKIGNLDLLIEANKGDTYKYTADWKKDLLTISTTEDITLSMGALAHLYKLLYWSRPHGKHLLPENLLKFNCDIIVSEVRNMQRVRKNLDSGNLEVLKDNCARYVFSLRECQFYFDKLPVDNDIDLGAEPKMQEGYTFQLDYKYSSQRLERFVPNGQWGTYVGYDAGSIWKIGNKESGSARTGTSSMAPNPPFITTGNTLNENGVTKPIVVDVAGFEETDPNQSSQPSATDPPAPDETAAGVPAGPETNAPAVSLDTLKQNTENAQLASEQASKDAETIKKTSKIKAGNPAGGVLSELNIKKVRDAVSDITGVNPTMLKNKAYATIASAVSSKFFDVQGSLGLKSGEPSKGSLNSIKTKFTESDTKATTGFFDVRGGLKESINGGKSDSNGGVPSLESLTTKFSQAVEIPSTSFFDVRSQTKGPTEKGNTDTSQIQKNLLNNTLNKVYGTPAKAPKTGKSSPPPSTSFFDIKGQLKDFLGGPLGDKLTGE